MIAAAIIAALTITHDEGGRVDAYAAAVAAETGRVRIIGVCESACTMWLGANDVCVAPSARFIFHPPRNGFFGRLPPVEFWKAVNTIASHYPPRLGVWYRAVVAPQGGYWKITGQQMIDLYDVEECA